MIGGTPSEDGWMCLYQAVIPENFIVNDNHGQHYRVHQRNLEWLTWQYESIRSGFFEVNVGRGSQARKVRVSTCGAMGFVMPSASEVRSMLQGCSGVSMRCEVWKVSDRRFDPQNYAKTFKAPLDMLVHDGYIEDDSWKFVEGITYAGGGPSALHRFKASKGDLETLQLLGLSNALDQIVGQGEGFSGTCDAVFKRRASVDGGSAGVRANDILIRILVHPSQR